jgi:hypothetical protein
MILVLLLLLSVSVFEENDSEDGTVKHVTGGRYPSQSSRSADKVRQGWSQAMTSQAVVSSSLGCVARAESSPAAGPADSFADFLDGGGGGEGLVLGFAMLELGAKFQSGLSKIKRTWTCWGMLGVGGGGCLGSMFSSWGLVEAVVAFVVLVLRDSR